MTHWVRIGEGGDVFDELRENRRIIREAEMRELALIAQACDESGVDESRADAAAEKLISGGAAGTAPIGEFLALELAGLLQITPGSAALRIRQVLDLRDRHPELWLYVHAGRVEAWRALRVAARCSESGLSAEAARWVDHQLGVSLAALPWPRAVRALEGLIVKADSALAAERAGQRRSGRRVFVGDHADGASVLFARLDTADALALDQTISDVANALAAAGNDDPVDARRSTALGILADPRAALDLLSGHGDGRPTNRQATLYVHVHAEGVANAVPGPAQPARAVARVECVGPLDLATLRRFLAGSRVVVRPVVDLNAPPAVDAYEAPERLREHLLARHPVEVFPFGARPARGLDLDHTRPYDPDAPPGARQTRADNLGPLSRKAHRAKTARLWGVEQPEPGTFVWTSPHGFQYRVTPEGTTPLGRRGARPDWQVDPEFSERLLDLLQSLPDRQPA